MCAQLQVSDSNGSQEMIYIYSETSIKSILQLSTTLISISTKEWSSQCFALSLAKKRSVPGYGASVLHFQLLELVHKGGNPHPKSITKVTSPFQSTSSTSSVTFVCLGAVRTPRLGGKQEGLGLLMRLSSIRLLKVCPALKFLRPQILECTLLNVQIEY